MDDATKRILPYLLPGESLLWLGRPDPRRHFNALDALLVPISIMWTGFAVVWMAVALMIGAPVLLAACGLPFVIVGIYFVAGRFVLKALDKRSTIYALTGRRALVSRREGSITHCPLSDAQVDQRRSSGGRHLTVTFGRLAGIWRVIPALGNTGLVVLRGGEPLTFYDVADVGPLERVLRDVQT